MKRWIVNGSLYLFNIVAIYWVFNSLTLSITGEGFGIISLLGDIPIWAEFLIFLVFFDLFQYLIHVASHHNSVLWRIHVTHHADVDIDSTTSFRHHPFEFCLECSMRLIALLITGASLPALIAYDVLLTSHTFFAHSNVRVPEKIDFALRKVIITPDMHRIHHSIEPEIANSNYGFIFSIWDHLFSSHKVVPQEKQRSMVLGIDYFREPKDQGFFRTLLQPFSSKINWATE